jgi:hypothetical protein
MPNATVRANARTLPKATKSMSAAPALPEATPQDEYLRALAAKCVADARLEVATEKRKAEAAAKAEEPTLEASEAFSKAYHAWLIAKAGIEEPEIAEEEQPCRFRAESDAERRLFTTPVAYSDQFWQKLTAFERILGEELAVGLRRDSILLLALGSIKQDVLNLDICN